MDESCFREAQSSDIFVLIIGGRYGSEVSETESGDKGFHDRYESITRKEYESALQRDIPTYVLIEKSVYSEYETFKRNRENETIKYAYVDSINIFTFIEYVLSRPRNSPVYHFELSSEIETWLREQWAGLFRELIRNRADKTQISSLADQVRDLSNVSTTLKRYLEELVSRGGNKEQAKEIINEEQARLMEARKLNELAKLPVISYLRDVYDVPLETSRSMFTEATSLNNLAERIERVTKGAFKANALIPGWKQDPELSQNMNDVREALDLPALRFEEGKRKERSTAHAPRKTEIKK